MADFRIDKENTYILVEDQNNKIFRMPLYALGDIIIMNDLENEKVKSLIDAIDELSTYILDLSSDFVANHYSYEELSTEFELKEDVDNLLIDKSILTDNDVEKHIRSSGLVPIDVVDEKYDNEEQDADQVFDGVETEAESYIAEEQ